MGFGGVSGSTAVSATFEPGTDVEHRGRGMIARGGGCSYGDAAQRGGGVVVHVAAVPSDIILDAASATVKVSAGHTIRQVCQELLKQGWFLPVVPGTSFATIGGCIAADVHGKNHVHVGSFGQHVVSIDLVDGSGVAHHLSATEDPDAFWATVAGMGLTGVIVSASLRMIADKSGWMTETTAMADSFAETMSLMRELAVSHHHVAAWVDLRSRHRGVGVVSAANHLGASAFDASRKSHQLRSPIPCPRTTMSVLGPQRLAFLNAAKVISARRHVGRVGNVAQQRVPIESVLWPLDAVANWNRLYGHHGFIQYQVAIPDGAEDVLIGISKHLATLPVYLCTLKQMGQASLAPMSFPLPGWTIALDIPANAPGLWDALHCADDAVAEVGGRVYLAKDVRMTAQHLPTMYPRLDEWRQVRNRLDPKGNMNSDLGSRLGLLDSFS